MKNIVFALGMPVPSVHFCSIVLLQVTQLDLHRHFHSLGVGVIEEVRLQRDKGFGFVRFNTHAEAALAIQMGNTQSNLCGRQIKVWFSDYYIYCKSQDCWLTRCCGLVQYLLAFSCWTEKFASLDPFNCQGEFLNDPYS